MNWRRPQHSLQRSAWRLFGHLAFSTSVFLAILVFAWILSFVFKYLNEINPFPVEIAKLFSKLEIWLFWGDIIVSGTVLVAGVLRFVWDTIAERD